MPVYEYYNLATVQVCKEVTAYISLTIDNSLNGCYLRDNIYLAKFRIIAVKLSCENDEKPNINPRRRTELINQKIQ